MNVKLLEIRDVGTLIPCVAIAIDGSDGPLARRAGYGSRCILFGPAMGGKVIYDPYSQTGRTMPTAHQYVVENWDSISDGDVVCVEHILGVSPCSCSPWRMLRTSDPLRAHARERNTKGE